MSDNSKEHDKLMYYSYLINNIFYDKYLKFDLVDDYCDKNEFDINQREMLLKEVWNKAILLLTQQQFVYIYLYFFEGLNQSEIANIFNCSQANVCDLLKTSIKKLKKYFEAKKLGDANELFKMSNKSNE